MANIVEIILKGKDQVTGPFRNATRSIKSFQTAALAVSRIAAGAITAATGALGALTINAARNAEEISNISRAVGFAVEPFSRLVFVAESFNIKLGDLRVGLNSFNKQILAAAENANSQAARAFQAMGIQIRDANGHIRKNSELFEEAADKFATYADGAEKSRLALFLFGDVGARMIPILDQGAEGIRKMGAETVGLTEETAAAASAFQLNLFKLKTALSDIGVVILQRIGPQLAEMSAWLVKLQKDNNAFGKSADFVISVLATLARGVRAITFVMGQLRIELAAVGQILGSTFIEALHGIDKAIREQLSVFSKLGDVIGLALSGEFTAAGKLASEAVKTSLGVKLIDQIKETGKQIVEDTKQIFSDTERQLADRKAEFDKFLLDLGNSKVAPAVVDSPLSVQGGLSPAPQLASTGAGGGGGQIGAVQGAIERNRASFEQLRQDVRKTYEDATNGGLAMLEAQRNLAQSFGEIWRNSLFNVRASFVNFASGVVTNFSNAFSQTVANVVTGAQTASEAFKALGTQMVAALIKFITQLAINTAIAASLQGTLVAATSAAITPILASWTAAATAASIATLGTATAFAATVPAAQAANVAFAQGLSVVGGAAHGGLGYVPSEQTYLLDQGERVLSPNQNRDLTDFLASSKRGGGGPVHITVNLDGRPIIDTVAEASRDGRLVINGRSVV